MLQMLRDERIDIDARMSRARSNCQVRITAEAGPGASASLDEAIENCTVVEQQIVYAQAINEMNANRQSSFADAMTQHNAEVAEAARRQRQHEADIAQHNTEVAEAARRQREYERDLAAHEQLVGGKGQSAPSRAAQPAQAANVAQDTLQQADNVQVAQAASAPLASAQPAQTVPMQTGPTQSGPTQPAPTQIANVTANPARQPETFDAAPTETVPAARTRQARTGSTTINTARQPTENLELAIKEASGPRVALIIGNESYTGSMGELSNPVNDVVLIGATLRGLGFDVEILTDASQVEMKQAVQRFGDRLHGAGENATGLFYYAGHGVQSKGVNFLIPVGSTVDAESDLELEAVSAESILSQMEEAFVTTRIVILDACRNMPLRRRTRDGTRGLARMETPNGSFVAYSTSPGNTAADGDGIHSPFAQALAEQMLVPDRPIEVTFREVRRQVVEMTGGTQVPWDASSLLETFSFAELN